MAPCGILPEIRNGCIMISMSRMESPLEGNLFNQSSSPEGVGDLPPIYSFEDLRPADKPPKESPREAPEETPEPDGSDAEFERILAILRKHHPGELDSYLRRLATIEANWKKKPKNQGPSKQGPRKK
jgi:hypothetical protein